MHRLHLIGIAWLLIGVSSLESGWLLGPEKIEGKVAVVDVRSGRGRIVLFGFPPSTGANLTGPFGPSSTRSTWEVEGVEEE